MGYMYSGDLAIVDLESGSVEFREFTELHEHSPGLGACLALFREHEESNPLVIGSGIFTGTTLPGSSLGFILAKTPTPPGVSVLPLVLYAGTEVKYSGFSAVVLRGNAPSPVYLWLHDGVADILDASDLVVLDTWSTTDSIRSEMGDRLVQVISCGHFDGAEEIPNSLSINYWGSLDKGNTALSFIRKNLKAVAIRGLGMIDAFDPHALVMSSLGLLKKCEPSDGFGLWGNSGSKIDSWVKPLVHRYRSCHGCPMACFPFLKYKENPSFMASDGLDEPGILLTDFAALEALEEKGLGLEDSLKFMEACYRLGVNSVALSRLIDADGVRASKNIEDIVNVIQTLEIPETENPAVFTAWSLDDRSAGLTEEVNRAAYTLGVCPVFMARSGIQIEEFLELSEAAFGSPITWKDINSTMDRLL